MTHAPTQAALDALSVPQENMQRTASAAAWPGHATAAGTTQFAAAKLGFLAAAGHFREHTIDYTGLGAAGSHDTGALMLSSLGVGTYLGAADAHTDEMVTNAIVKSVGDGWNVIDTASNYRDGRAEVSVGAALHALRMTGAVQRSELFVSTKAGYVAGDGGGGFCIFWLSHGAAEGGPPCVSHAHALPMEYPALPLSECVSLNATPSSSAGDIISRLRSSGELSATEVVNSHCMAPACLRESLARSLQSMRVGGSHRNVKLHLKGGDFGGVNQQYLYISCPMAPFLFSSC
jgi:hypothetical protein